jgi:hypothetical protein
MKTQLKNWLCLMILSLALAACGNPPNSGPTLDKIVATGGPCVSPKVAPDKFEPKGNTLSTSIPVVGVWNATLHDSSDVDYYKVTYGGGKYALDYVFELRNTDTPLTLTWYEVNGTKYTKLGSKTFSDCQTSDSVSIPKGKTYIFEVKHYLLADSFCSMCSYSYGGNYNFRVGEIVDIPPLKEYCLYCWIFKTDILGEPDPNPWDSASNPYRDPEPSPLVLVGQLDLYLITKSEQFSSLALEGAGIHLTLFDSEGNQLDKGRAAFDDTGLQTGETLSLSTVEVGQDYILAVERLLTDKVANSHLPVLNYSLKGIR